MRRLLQSSVFALAVGVSLFSCTTPSVPIPPPEPGNISFSVDIDAGQASFSYRPAPSFANAIVYVFNRDAGVGVITMAEDDGSVAPTQPFAAMDGDEVLVTFELEDQLASTCVVLREGQSSSANECSL
jgi:hypothetical protein